MRNGLVILPFSQKTRKFVTSLLRNSLWRNAQKQDSLYSLGRFPPQDENAIKTAQKPQRGDAVNNVSSGKAGFERNLVPLNDRLRSLSVLQSRV